jgi:hypothetical protein
MHPTRESRRTAFIIVEEELVGRETSSLHELEPGREPR